MKIIVNGRFLTQPVTGVQQYALRFAAYLKNAWPEKVTVVAPQNIVHPALADKLEAITIGSSTGYMWEQAELPLWLARKKSPLLINLGNMAPPYYRNQIATVHDLATLEHPEWFSRSFAAAYRIMLPRIIENARGIAAVSEFTRNQMIKRFPGHHEKIKTIYNTAPEEAPVHLEKQPYMVAVGSISGRKNFKILADAFEAADLKGFVLKIRGSYDKIYDENIHQHLNAYPFVHLVEPLSYLTYLDMISYSQCLINLSLYEGFGMPNLEALACGTPVICSDLEVFREVCSDQATYLNPTDSSAITTALIQHKNQGIDKKMIERMQQRAAMFSLTTEGPKMLEWIDQLIA